MSEEKEYKHIVIDNGTNSCKFGFSGDEEPRIIPTCVGCPKYPYHSLDKEKKDFYFGTEALSKIGVFKLKYPIEHGTIKNWDDMEKIWGNIFSKLRVAPEEHNVLINIS